MDFTTLTSLTPLPGEAGRFQADVPDGWQQGRGAFGGLVLALLTRAIERLAATSLPAGEQRRLRALTATLCGPTMVGPAEIQVEALRVGSGVATYNARLLQGGEVQAQATAALGRDRAQDLAFLELERPPVTPWQELAPPPVEVPLAPAFFRHVELRPAGGMPLSAGDRSLTLNWLRLREPGAARDAASVVALADASWPSTFVRLAELRPMSTVAFTVELVKDPASLDPREPLLHVGRTPVLAGGFAIELRELWTEAGELVALNQQTFAVIR